MRSEIGLYKVSTGMDKRRNPGFLLYKTTRVDSQVPLALCFSVHGSGLIAVMYREVDQFPTLATVSAE